MLPLFKKAMLAALGAGLLFPAIAQAETSKPATAVTAKVNQAVLNELPFADTRSFEDARRGFVGALPNGRVVDEEGHVAWDMEPYAFLNGDSAPDSVNPSLWRMAQLNAIHGLFEVVDGMYQVRNMDLSNMTIIEGDSGLIVIDPLLTPATARAGLELYYQHRSKKPVVAVLYTHNHADHFGGVKGVVNEEDVRAGKVRIYAPEGFMEHAIAENVIAGNAMTRRATYQFGAGLPPGVRGHVDTGLGKALGSGGLSLIAPTDTVPDNANLTIDGIDIEFQMAHGTEAESEMMMYFPQFRVLNTAEITSQHLHNIYTIRGAAIRDANSWSKFIDKVLVRFADRAARARDRVLGGGVPRNVDAGDGRGPRADGGNRQAVRVRQLGNLPRYDADRGLCQPARCVPGFRPRNDRRGACARHPCGLCQRLPAHAAAAGPGALGRRGCDARLGQGVVRARTGLGRV